MRRNIAGVCFKFASQGFPVQCARCRQEFKPTDLNPPAFWLYAGTFPLLIFKPRLLGDASALYCQPCRRAVSVVLFFIVAMIAIGGLAAAIAYLIPPEMRHAHARQQKADRTPQQP
jgi:hypothetical protein